MKISHFILGISFLFGTFSSLNASNDSDEDGPMHLHVMQDTQSDHVVIPVDHQRRSPLRSDVQTVVPIDPIAEHRRQEKARWAMGETFYYYLGAVNNNLGILCGGASTLTAAIAAGITDTTTKEYLILTTVGLSASSTMFLYFGTKAAAAEKDRHDKVEAVLAQGV